MIYNVPRARIAIEKVDAIERFPVASRTGCLAPLNVSPPTIVRFRDGYDCRHGDWSATGRLTYTYSWRNPGIEGLPVAVQNLLPWSLGISEETGHHLREALLTGARSCTVTAKAGLGTSVAHSEIVAPR